MIRGVLPALLLLTALGPAGAQRVEPVVDSIANAASLYRPPRDVREPGLGVAGGSIIAIFGQNLARSTVAAPGFPLPTAIEDTSVLIGGAAAPLLFVSPGQINAVVPSALTLPILPHGQFYTVPVVVRLGGVASFPRQLRITFFGHGLFSADGSGCGQGLIYQRGPDGTVSLNGPDNSADPGKTVIALLGTGFGAMALSVPPIPDGEPIPATPPPGLEGYHLYYPPITFFNELVRDTYVFLDPFSRVGRATGLVGIDARTMTLPEVPEGCAVPVRVAAGHSMSQNVTMSVRRGGGRCVDPPIESAGLITWERMVTSGLQPSAVEEALRVEFLAAPGKQLPVRDTIRGGTRELWVELEGPTCPGPVDTRLDAGEITARGPGWGPVRALPDANGVYRVPLPANAIREGSFTVAAAGGKDVGPFESTARIPAPITLNGSYPPGTGIRCCLVSGQLPTFTWTGGDGQSWVRVGVLSRPTTAGRGHRLWENEALASAGQVRIVVLQVFGIPPAENADLLVTMDPANPVAFQARGLTRGGLHRWVYRWRYTGLRVTGEGVPP